MAGGALILTGVFAAEVLGGAGFGGGISSIGGQLLAQATGIIATIVYTGIVSFILLKILDSVMGFGLMKTKRSKVSIWLAPPEK